MTATWHDRRQSSAYATLLLVGLATSSCQALIGLDDVGPRPATRPPTASAGGSGEAPGMSQAGTGGMASGGATSPEPAGGAPCNVEPPLISGTAAPVIPVATAPTSPAVDGEADDVWCLARKFQPRLSAGNADALSPSGSGQLFWDKSRLYLLLEVEDDVLYQEGFFWYENDYAWVGVDPTPGDVGGDELLFGFTASSRDAQDFESWPTFDRTRLLIAQTRSADRSTFEVSIPWDLMTGFVPAPGQTLGFELRVADTDDGADQATLSWANSDEASYEQPDSWGSVTLVGPP